MSEVRTFGKFRLDTAQKVLFFENAPIDLPLKEIEVLCVLTKSPGNVVSKQELLDKVWSGAFVEESNISRHVYLLRKLFKDMGEDGEMIQTVPRRGYRFAGAVTTGGQDIIIERHILEQTIVEEIDVPETRRELPAGSPHRRLTLMLISATVTVTLLAGFAVWRYTLAVRTDIAEIRSIAVLPLKSFATGQTDEDLRLRITDALITKLASGETALSVRPTRAILPYTNTEKDSVGIGKTLEVDAVIDGRVQQEGERLRVTLQLVSVRTGEQIWSQQFDGRVTGILDLQDAISAQLTQKLNLHRRQDVAKRPTANDEAYEHYLKGRFFWNKRSAEGLRNAISSFEKAIAIDPNFAEAYVGLADSYYLLVDYSYDTSPKNVGVARENLNKAILIDPLLAEAYTTLGTIQTTYEWDWKGAGDSLRKAKELAPNSSNAHHRYGLLLIKLRRYDEAEAELRRAKVLDPTSASINMNLGIAFQNAKKYDQALDQLQKALELDSNFTAARWYLARCHWLRNEKKQAIIQWAKAIENDGDRDLANALTESLSESGETAAMQKLALEWQKSIGYNGINEHDIAIIKASLGERSETLDWLEKLFTAHHPWATWIYSEPEFDFVRDDPRFIALMKKMNFA